MSEEGKGMGLTFGFSGAAKKPTRKLNLQDRDEGPKKDVLTGVGADGGLQSAEPQAAPEGPKIIPRQENTYRQVAENTISRTFTTMVSIYDITYSNSYCPSNYLKKLVIISIACRSNARPGFVPSFIPDAAGTQEIAEGIEHFQTAAHDTEIAQQDVTYGLIKRKPDTDSKSKKEKDRSADKPSAPPSEAEVLKLDLEQLPPEASLEAYEEMPVEAFGEALLRGMGWQEGRAIGRGNKKEVVTKDLVRRPHRLGLGAAPAPAPETHKKYIKPGESRAPQDNVYVDPSTGALKSTKDATGGAPSSAAQQGRKRPLPGVLPGKVMEIVEGRHRGLQCEVQSLEPREPGRSERAKVRLLPSYEVVVVRCSDLDEITKGSNRDGRDNRGKERYRERGGSGSGRETKRRKEHDSSSSKDRSKAYEEETPWLVPNIRVKIVDKRLQGGKFYLNKGIIVDVKSPTLCDVFIDGTKESVLDVRQSQLETVVPGTEGTPIQVLVGKYKGQRGRLLQRNTSTGLAAVQLTGDMSVHKLSLDDISEYCGLADGWDE